MGSSGASRISVVGTSGAGKTTVARETAARLDVPHVELDGLYHQPGWEPLPRELFRDRWSNLLDPRPAENIVLWAWTRYGPHRESYSRAETDPRWAHLRFVRLRCEAEMCAYLDGLG